MRYQQPDSVRDEDTTEYYLFYVWMGGCHRTLYALTIGVRTKDVLRNWWPIQSGQGCVPHQSVSRVRIDMID